MEPGNRTTGDGNESRYPRSNGPRNHQRQYSDKIRLYCEMARAPEEGNVIS